MDAAVWRIGDRAGAGMAGTTGAAGTGGSNSGTASAGASWSDQSTVLAVA
jgi:hypothetical protein